MRNLIYIFLNIFLLSLSSVTAQQDSLRLLLNTNLSPQQHLHVLEKLIEANKYENRPQSLAYGKQAYQYESQQDHRAIKAKGCELLGNAYFINFKYDSALLYLKEGLEWAGDEPRYNERLFLYIGDAFWYSGHFDSALSYHTKGQKSALETKNLSLAATLTINIADYYRQTGNFEKSLEIYWEGIAYAEQDESGTVLPKAYNNAAMLYGYLGDTYTELDYYFKAVDAGKKPCCTKTLGLLYANIAEAYTTLGEYQKALKFITIGIDKSKETHQQRYLMAAYEILGVLYLKMDSIPQARAAFTESMQLNELLKDKRFIARNLGNLGDVEKQAKNYPQAIQYYNDAITVQDQIAERKFKIEDLLGLAQTYLEIGKLNAAKENSDAALRLAHLLGIRTFMAQSLLLISEIHERNSDIKRALIYRKEYDSIHSILEKEERLKYVSNLEKLNTAKLKELENLTLKNDMAIQAGVIESQQRLFMVGLALIIFLLAISFFIFWLLKKNQKTRRLISIQNASLKAKNEEIQAMSDLQENLMHLVAHDLRSPLDKIEGLINLLRLGDSLTSSQLELINRMEEVSINNKIFISEFLETSRIQHHSKQPKKEFFDLLLLLEEIQKEYAPLASKKEIEISYDFILPPKQAKSDRNLLYHIIINLLSNAIKYSTPNTQIQCKVWSKGSDLYLLIKDQGQGFTERDKELIFKKFQKLSAQPIGPENATGLGLFLTKILVDSLNGEIFLESEHLNGSTFTVFIKNVFQERLSKK